MKEFLRREWRSDAIPREIFDEARRAAWGKLNRPSQSTGRRLWVPAMAALLLLLALGWFARPEGPVPREIDRSVARLPLVQLPRMAPDPLPEVVIELPKPSRTNEIVRFEGVRPPVPDLPKRLVMNFMLPRSRVRMIWIKENQVENFGGEE